MDLVLQTILKDPNPNVGMEFIQTILKIHCSTYIYVFVA